MLKRATVSGDTGTGNKQQKIRDKHLKIINKHLRIRIKHFRIRNKHFEIRNKHFKIRNINQQSMNEMRLSAILRTDCAEQTVLC